LIQQHYFTRNIKGLYSNMPGYDTMAKSKGLNDNFIKDVLHPLCRYNPPIELTYAGNGNLDIFPQAVTCVHTDDGTMILGRIIYTGTDSIGFRNTFFAHNYIIPKEDKKCFLKDSSKLLYVDSFSKKHNPSDGTELPEISELTFNKDISELDDTEVLFNKLKIDATIYKKLLAALFLSSLNKKCIYVSLCVGASEFTNCSKVLMEKLLEGLPYELRKKIGFITYSREVRKMQNVNIIFVEKGGIVLDDGDELESYIFDLSKEVYTNVNIDVDKHYYLEYIWRNLKNRGKIEEFHELADDMLQKQNENLKSALDVYNQLAVFYDLIEGEEEYYIQNKGECFKGVYELGSLTNINNKDWLNEIFTTMFKREIQCVENVAGYISSVTFIETLVNYYNEASPKHKERIFEVIAISIMNSNEVGTFEYSLKVMEKVREKKELFTDFINTIYESKRLRKAIVLWYVEECFNKLESLDEVFNEMTLWANVCYRVAAHRNFHDIVKIKLVKSIDKQPDKLTTTNSVFNFLNTFCEGRHEIVKENLMSIVEEIDEKMFLLLDLKDVTEESLIKLDISEEHVNDDKMKALSLLRELVFTPKEIFAFRTMRKRILEIPSPYREQFRTAILNLCIKDINLKYFDKIILGFDIEEKEETIIDFNHFFVYVFRMGGEKTLIELFKWISDNVYFSSLEQNEFKKAVGVYLGSEEMELINNKNVREELYKTLKGAIFREVVEEQGGAKKVLTGFKSKLGGIWGKSPDE